MRVLLLLLIIIIVSAVYANQSYCQWKVNGNCKICTFNLYLVNGNCVKSCPSGYVERRPNRVFSWKREIGGKCEIKRALGITTWGSSIYGGSGAPSSGTYVNVFSTCCAFAALKDDGSIAVWGRSAWGGSGAPSSGTYVNVFSTLFAFAALKDDGSIAVWGESSQGGCDSGSGGVDHNRPYTCKPPSGSGTYVNIFSTASAFAALKDDGSIAVWGQTCCGGSGAPSSGTYVNIFSTSDAFAALKDDGSIAVWGDSDYGGSGAPSSGTYVNVFSTYSAFAALKDDGSIAVWGDSDSGGSGAPSSGTYVNVFSTQFAFAALKDDGSIAVWGDSDYGGSGAPSSGTYVNVFSTDAAFAALKDDGSIAVWGDSSEGGSGAPSSGTYVNVFSTFGAFGGAFAALKDDGSIRVWGSSSSGGSGAPSSGTYVNVFSTGYAFAALKDDGSIAVWGDSSYGGSGAPSSGTYVNIFSTDGAFAAMGCEKGTFTKSGECMQCSVGQYTDQLGQSSCKDCGTGKFNDLEGQSNCKNCGIGKFNNLQGQSDESVACRTCPLNTLIEGASECCTQPGKYQNNDQCFDCPQPQYCLGGTTCKGNREGLACMKCKANYYTLDGNNCIKCPESSIGQWIIAIAIIILCIFIIHKILKENFVEEEDEENKKNDNDDVTREKVVKSSLKGLAKSVKMSRRNQSRKLHTGFSILAKHTLYFSFTIGLIPLIHLPAEIRQMLQSFLSLFTFDLSNFVSSPECDWKAPTAVKHIIKMCLPLLFVVCFLSWYTAVKVCVHCAKNKNPTKYVRNLKNQIIGAAIFLWITSLYSLNAYQTLSAFDCTTTPSIGGGSSITLDMDPQISCYDNKNHASIIIFSLISMLIYTFIPICYYIRKREKHMPEWVDPHNCPNFKKEEYDTTIISSGFIGSPCKFCYRKIKCYWCKKKTTTTPATTFNKPINQPCHNCEYCDYRQRYGWFYSKYHNKCFNYEFIVLVQKILISGITLFFTIRKNVALSMLISVNILFIFITAYYQPYLTDVEFLRIHELGHKKANVQRNKKCKKESLGVNNSLDILLLSGEICICISSLITYNLDQTLQSKSVESLKATINSNSTVNGTSDLLSEQQEALVVRIANKYPIENVIIVIFDIIGLLLFFSGFIYFAKETCKGLYASKRIKARSEDEESDNIDKDDATKKVTEEKLKKAVEMTESSTVTGNNPLFGLDTDKIKRKRISILV